MSVYRLTVMVAALVAVLGGLLFWWPDEKQRADRSAMVNVTVPALGPDEQQGSLLFNDNCASCHGVNAAGQKGVAPPLIHKIYEPGHHADISFLLAAKNGVRAHHWPFGNMPPVPSVNAEDVAQIVRFIRSVQRANGIN